MILILCSVSDSPTTSPTAFSTTDNLDESSTSTIYSITAFSFEVSTIFTYVILLIIGFILTVAIALIRRGSVASVSDIEEIPIFTIALHVAVPLVSLATVITLARNILTGSLTAASIVVIVGHSIMPVAGVGICFTLVTIKLTIKDIDVY